MKFSKELGNAGLAFADFDRMEVQERKAAISRRVDYAWAFSDEKVRRVVAAHVAVIANARAIPDTLDALKALDTLATSRLAVNRSAHNRMCAAAARRVGGLAPLYAALVYRAIRLGENSVQLATDLGISPWGARQTLYRLNKTAQQLAAGTLPLRRPMKYGKYRRARWNFKAAIPLRAAGLSYREIAVKFGMASGTVRDTFVKAGVIYPRVHRGRPKAHRFNHRAALEMRQAGCTYREIAERFGVRHGAIQWALQKSPTLKPAA